MPTEITPPVNKPIAFTNRVIEGLIFDVGINLAKAAAIAEAPWLAWPVISQVFDFILNRFGVYIYNGLSTCAIIGGIDIQVGGELTRYQDAVAKLKAAHDIGDADAIAKAKEEFKATYRDLIANNGIVPERGH